jgi:hypothetical protein
MRRQQIRALNDAFRKGDRPGLGRIMVTRGVLHLVGREACGRLGRRRRVGDGLGDGLGGRHAAPSPFRAEQ